MIKIAKKANSITKILSVFIDWVDFGEKRITV